MARKIQKLEFQTDISACQEVLDRGGIILYPTDTIWGLGCDALNEFAVQRLLSLKKRPSSKSLIILVQGVEELNQYTGISTEGIYPFLESLVDPTTIIYPGAKSLAPGLLASDGTVAIRVVRDKFCSALIKQFRKPIVSSSANLSGEPSPGHFREISEEIKKGSDYIVRFRQDDPGIGRASTILRWHPDGTFSQVRP
jgi:L-threonylcarbamoyladenylate synthase